MKKLPLKQALLDLLYVDVHLPKVAEDYPELSSLINFIVDHNSLDDDDVPYPTIKEVAQATKMRYDRVENKSKNCMRLCSLLWIINI